MKTLMQRNRTHSLWSLLRVAMVLGAMAIAIDASVACSPLLDHSLNTLQGKRQDLCEYQGKVLLVVNTASYCAFTPQYKALEAIYEKYASRGLVVLGFPSNDFGHQEPGSNEEVAEFCERTYKVQFPMFEKSVVRSPGGNPIFDQLARMTGERPSWNFHKYLVDRSGTAAMSFSTLRKPDDRALVAKIEQLLEQK